MESLAYPAASAVLLICEVISNSKWLVMNCTVHIQIYLSSIKFPGGKVIGRDADFPSVNS